MKITHLIAFAVTSLLTLGIASFPQLVEIAQIEACKPDANALPGQSLCG